MSGLRPALVGLGLAAPATAWAFRGRGRGFWLRMLAATGGLGGYALILEPDLRAPSLRPRDLVAGAVSAAALYGAFRAGSRCMQTVWPAATEKIDALYQLAGGLPAWAAAGMLTAVIAPGEELLWRGLLQGSLARRFGRLQGVGLAAACYAAVHLVSGNVLLAAAAATAGAFWGLQYTAQRRLAPVIVSHILWDLLIFLIAPLSRPMSRPARGED